MHLRGYLLEYRHDGFSIDKHFVKRFSAMRPEKGHIYIIGTGVGPEDLSRRSLELIAGADLLVGGRRLLGWFAESAAEKIVIGREAARQVQSLKRRLRGRRIAVLASGDPDFFGIARLFYEHFKPAQLSVIPNATAFQWACARIQLPWDGMHIVSVHGRKLSELHGVLARGGDCGIYCDPEHTPAAVARYLIERRPELADTEAWVCSDIGSPCEKIRSAPLRRIAKKHAPGLSVMILTIETSAAPAALGLPDEAFIRQRGMITRRDVRLLVLSRLELEGCSVLWDVGAASGSVSIEAANVSPSLRAFAVEQHAERYAGLQANIEKLCAGDVTAVCGCAPEALRRIPAPDRVFIGGSGDRLGEILAAVKKRLRGRGPLVMNCVTPDTLQAALTVLRRWGWAYQVTTLQLSYLESARAPEIFRAENPVWVIQARKNNSID